jgi:hypothetical protein
MGLQLQNLGALRCVEQLIKVMEKLITICRLIWQCMHGKEQLKKDTGTRIVPY